jgi:hypothetical protein
MSDPICATCGAPVYPRDSLAPTCHWCNVTGGPVLDIERIHPSPGSFVWTEAPDGTREIRLLQVVFVYDVPPELTRWTPCHGPEPLFLASSPAGLWESYRVWCPGQEFTETNWIDPRYLCHFLGELARRGHPSRAVIEPFPVYHRAVPRPPAAEHPRPRISSSAKKRAARFAKPPAPIEGVMRPACARRDCDGLLDWTMEQCERGHRQPAPPIRLYASRTGSAQNLAALAREGWALLTAPSHLDRYPDPRPPWRYALDNGAWEAFSSGQPWDRDAFLRALELLHDLADWVVLPDIVAGGEASLERSLLWADTLRDLACPRLLAVQDGMTPEGIRPLLAEHRIGGIFLGGSTAWKLDTMAAWGALARELGVLYHVGRVNSARRIQQARQAGAHSCDGTSATRFSVNAAPLATAAEAAIPASLFAWGEVSEHVAPEGGEEDRAYDERKAG